MKKILAGMAFFLMALASCSKKTHPAASIPSKPTTIASNMPVPGNETITVSPAPAPAVTKAAKPTPPAPDFSSPMIVIDEAGNVITAKEQLPADIAEKVDYKKITRAFTPTQRQNLVTRFKMVPPKVLFIPASLTSKSARGTYIIYKKKFYYWKKDDGLFYLDDTYYQ
jgi:hypothetical protein